MFGSSLNVDFLDNILRTDQNFAQNTHPTRVLLSPGDSLYLPAFWHHEVQSLPDLQGLNMAVNFWFSNMTAPIDDLAILNVKPAS